MKSVTYAKTGLAVAGSLMALGVAAAPAQAAERPVDGAAGSGQLPVSTRSVPEAANPLRGAGLSDLSGLLGGLTKQAPGMLGLPLVG